MNVVLEPLLLACVAYVIGSATPGPATLLIATTSMRAGRRVGLATALGVLSGSLVWGLMAATGVAVALAAWTPLAQGLRVAGGLYLLWLSVKSIRSAVSAKAGQGEVDAVEAGVGPAFLRGLLVHLTNPKAVLSWLATVAVGTPAMAPPGFAFVVVAVCWCIGIGVFCGYAIAFARPGARAFYLRSRRRIDALAGAVFGAAGLMLLARRA